jgi:hypothetical protein
MPTIQATTTLWGRLDHLHVQGSAQTLCGRPACIPLYPEADLPRERTCKRCLDIRTKEYGPIVDISERSVSVATSSS